MLLSFAIEYANCWGDQNIGCLDSTTESYLSGQISVLFGIKNIASSQAKGNDE